jgi:2-dehydro-3-deoxyphosphogluconate aldolase/(4S)-4-hydroxy-2-oxoglutarate aldolase
LIASLRRQPLLAVLRPSSFPQAHRQLAQLQAVGLVHGELAVERDPARRDAWAEGCRALIAAFPGLQLGAASVRSLADLQLSRAAGFRYAVSPILDFQLLAAARQAGLTLVPGVFSPTEIEQARRMGCPAVKLFPAQVLGPGYWLGLAGPLGPLPFCIAAGGLRAADVEPWLAAGVQAVALGSALFAQGTEEEPEPRLDPQLPALLQRLAAGAEAQ